MPCSRCTAESRACTFDGGPSALLSSVSQSGEGQVPKKRRPRRKSSRSPSKSPDRDRKRKSRKEDPSHPSCKLLLACFCMFAESSFVTNVYPGLYAYLALVLFGRGGYAFRRLDFRHASAVSDSSALRSVADDSARTQENFFNPTRPLHRLKRPTSQRGITLVDFYRVIWEVRSSRRLN
jgi:hypothetical protein